MRVPTIPVAGDLQVSGFFRRTRFPWPFTLLGRFWSTSRAPRHSPSCRTRSVSQRASRAVAIFGSSGPGRYAAVLTGRVAFMTVRFNVTIEILNVYPPEAIEARITGDAVGLVGHVAATAAVRLADESDERTRLNYSTEIALTGKLGGIGQPVFQATSVRLAREFGDNLKKAIEGQRTGTAA